MKNVFITYNHNSEIGENTALRMQTLSNLYGYSVQLPYRLQNSTISSETKARISKSKFILAFAMNDLTEVLRNELEFALGKNKPIIVIYDQAEGETIDFYDNANVKTVFIDYYKTEDALHKISVFLEEKFRGIEQQKRNTENAIGTALVGIGLGLLAYWALSGKKMS